MSLSLGDKLGPYEILASIGAGGMGEVYRAQDSRLGREVAIKVLPASFAADPDRLRRFELEARATGMLNHPNILGVYGIGTHEGAPYLVTELLEGDTLRAHLPVPRRKTIEYALQIAQGLAAAHAKGVTHRDLDTGRRELWKQIMPADRTGVVAIRGILPTPDGRAYAYSYLRALSELYVVEGLK
jgi:serine/threonine protein kinase